MRHKIDLYIFINLIKYQKEIENSEYTLLISPPTQGNWV